jgi:hypothetical protein
MVFSAAASGVSSSHEFPDSNKAPIAKPAIPGSRNNPPLPIGPIQNIFFVFLSSVVF